MPHPTAITGRRTDPAAVVEHIAPGADVVLPMANGEPVGLVDALEAHHERHGYFSLGTNAEYVAALISRVPFFLEANPRMPRTLGLNQIHVSQVLGWTEADRPLVEVPPAIPDARDHAIAEAVAERIPHAATLQVGIGAIPNAILGALGGHRDLGVHTELLSDGIVDLVERGVVTGTRKSLRPNKIVTTFALGTRRLYDWLDANAAVELLPVDYVNDPRTVARERRFISVNATTEVDLYGQCASATMAGRYWSSSGGQADFARGAMYSDAPSPIPTIATRSSARLATPACSAPSPAPPVVALRGGRAATAENPHLIRAELRMSCGRRARSVAAMTSPASVPSSPPLRVLVAGGGVAGLETVLALRALAGDRVAVELLAPGADYVARQLSVRTPFDEPAAPRLPVERIGAPVRRSALARVDVEAHVVHTTDGAQLAYDRLVVAIGARAAQSLPGALHFHGPRSAGVLEAALRAARPEPGRPIAFVVPPDLSWPLPLYELVLAAAAAGERDLSLVTAERRPLELFGPAASDAAARLLDRARVEVRTATSARGVFDGTLLVEPGGLTPVAAAITLPVLTGPAPAGLPHDAGGFVPVDERGRIPGVADVLAAGDATDTAVKQGGLAAQQADAAAATIAADAGVPVPPPPSERILRASLLTGATPLHLRTPLGRPEAGVASRRPLWRPAGKVAARYLAGFLAGTPDVLLADLTGLPAEGERLDDRAAQ